MKFKRGGSFLGGFGKDETLNLKAKEKEGQ